MYILRDVEKFLRKMDMPPTKFGRLVCGDPRLVHDMRNGRIPRKALSERITSYISQNTPSSP